ncbi:MAG: hypothetical protein ACO1SV_00345 [Fimbriimonas sp.]
MKKPLPIGAVIAAVVAALTLAAFFVLRNPNSTSVSANEQKILDAIDKAGGDPGKITDPEAKKLYEAGVQSGAYATDPLKRNAAMAGNPRGGSGGQTPR